MAIRRITLRLYPTASQEVVLAENLRLHADLYNAALQERRDAWKKQRICVGYLQQCRSLTIVRAENPEYAAQIQRGQNLTLKRLDRAFADFFRRVKAGQRPGFPRFRSYRRFSGWSLAADEGYKYLPRVSSNGRWFNGNLKLSRIGVIRARGKARGRADRVKQIDIMRRQGRWYASLVVDMEVTRQRSAHAVVGLDWGVETYATLAYGDGRYGAIPNDRLFAAQQAKAAERQRAASKSLTGRRSKTAQKKHLCIARAHVLLSNQRKDRAHKLSAKLVDRHSRIVTEELKIANMTRSSRGTVENPGKMVAQKAGLNREILDTAPGMLMRMLRYKAEEAGCELIFVNTRKYKPSQTCPSCGLVRKKGLSERQHRCGCGFESTRDQAAALVMLQVGLEDGRKPAGGSAPKTPPRAA